MAKFFKKIIILKTYFGKNKLVTFNVRIKNLQKKINIQNIIRDNVLLLLTFNIRIKKLVRG